MRAIVLHWPGAITVGTSFVKAAIAECRPRVALEKHLFMPAHLTDEQADNVSFGELPR